MSLVLSLQAHGYGRGVDYCLRLSYFFHLPAYFSLVKILSYCHFTTSSMYIIQEIIFVVHILFSVSSSQKRMVHTSPLALAAINFLFKYYSSNNTFYYYCCYCCFVILFLLSLLLFYFCLCYNKGNVCFYTCALVVFSYFLKIIFIFFLYYGKWIGFFLPARFFFHV